MRAKILSVLKSDNACGYDIDIVSKLVNARSDAIDDAVKEELMNIVENVDTNKIIRLVVDFYPHNVKPSFFNKSTKTWYIEFHDGHCYKEEYKWQRKKLK